MSIKKYIASCLCALPLAVAAQDVSITFDTEDYKAIGVYDSWEASPFRTGKLSGNVAVIDNFLNAPAPATGEPVNGSAKILGLQRSRFGSNTFGARIDLKNTFELTPTTKYVHVMVYKPVEGRVMVIGLGKRPERVGQSPETEQFWGLKMSAVKANEWVDVVVPAYGNGGIDIHSLVVVPDCESPHALTEDYLVYIDDIVVNDDPQSRTSSTFYPVIFEEEQTYTRNDRHLNGVKLNSPSAGVQSLTVPEANKMYNNATGHTFYAKAGEELTATFDYTGSWMNGFVYLDKGNDGKFDATLGQNGNIPEGSDVMAFSFTAEVGSEDAGYNSKGEYLTGQARAVLNPPSFTLPANLPAGLYRMRYKVDWASIDPAGNNSSSNHIVNNGGGVLDLMLNVHGDECNVNDANRNGEVLAADGSKLNGYKAPFLKPFTIKMNPENGFSYNGIRVRHGYNLSGDSLVYGNPQYKDVVYTSDMFNENDEFTIPAEVMDGDVEIEGLFVEKGTEQKYVKVTYSVVDEDETEIFSVAKTVLAGSEYPMFDVPESACSAAYYELSGVPDGNVGDEDETVVIKYKNNFPFFVSKSFDDASWYYLQLAADGYYLHNTDGTYMPLTSAYQTAEPVGANLWCFMGNAFTGMKIYNLEAGAEKILSSTTNTADGNTGGSTYPLLYAEPVPEGNNTFWGVAPGQTIGEKQGFFLNQVGYPSNRMNLRDNKLAYWTGGADAGSTFVCTYVDSSTIVGIENVENGATITTPTTYDLQGRPVSNARRGIYVREGKKVVIK